MALKPWEFDALTPREIDAMLEGYDARLLAPAPGFVWLFAGLLNVLGGPPVIQTPETVLGRMPTRK